MLLACLLAAAACDKSETVTRVVNLHVLPSCPIPPNTFGAYTATGDFAAESQSTLLPTDETGLTIDGIPQDVQSLSLDVETTPHWLGVTLVPPTGDLDVLLLPSDEACGLNTKVTYGDGMIFGAVDAHTLLVSGAAQLNQGTLPKTYLVDLDTGKASAMTIGLHTPRLRAATAPFGDAGMAVVAAGVGAVGNPVLEPDAEVYDPATGDFSPHTIKVANREDFAAVTLASGDVLLVGGRDGNGLVPACQRIVWNPDPASWTASDAGMPIVTRVSPYALRLADGTILVGGGFDDAGVPVPDVVYYSADATTQIGTTSLVPRTKHAFVALDGGGALFVQAPDPTDDPNDFQRAWLVTPGVATKITPDITTQLDDVKLFPRAEGGALLWTGTEWLQFDPWTGFAQASPAPSSGPDTPALATPDPGLRAWVAQDGTISLWRDSVRNAFATEGPYLTASSTTNLLAPDTFSTPTFDPVAGLALDAGQSVFVSDARYLDVTVDVDAPSGDLPLVVLRALGSEIEVGGSSCPYVAASTHVHVERRGANVSYSLGSAPVPCGTIAPDARVSVGVRGANAGSHALNFAVVR